MVAPTFGRPLPTTSRSAFTGGRRFCECDSTAVTGASRRDRCQTPYVEERWRERSKVSSYVDRVGTLAPRQLGEVELLEAMPGVVHNVLDLGCGDARLAQRVMESHPEVDKIVAVDTSEPMLELARSSLGSDPRVDPTGMSRSIAAQVPAGNNLVPRRLKTLFVGGPTRQREGRL